MNRLVVGMAVVLAIGTVSAQTPWKGLKEPKIPATMDNGSVFSPYEPGGVDCDTLRREHGRVWIPARSGCAASVSELRRIILLDGRVCDYVHTKDGTMLGLWCDEKPR